MCFEVQFGVGNRVEWTQGRGRSKGTIIETVEYVDGVPVRFKIETDRGKVITKPVHSIFHEEEE